MKRILESFLGGGGLRNAEMEVLVWRDCKRKESFEVNSEDLVSWDVFDEMGNACAAQRSYLNLVTVGVEIFIFYPSATPGITFQSLLN